MIKQNTSKAVLPPDPPPALAVCRGRGDYLAAGLYQLLRFTLAGIFIYAGFLKLLDPQAFGRSLVQFELLPDVLVPVVALGLPVLELAAGVGLILAVRGSLTVIAALLVLFLLVLGYAIWMGLEIDCGCFTLEETNARNGVKAAFWRDLLLLGATFFLFWWRRARLAPAPGRKKP